jgi:hypothetical protein
MISVCVREDEGMKEAFDGFKRRGRDRAGMNFDGGV